MLVLTRKVNDAVIIGDNIKVTLLSVEGEKVRIGIDAPKNIRILREETITKSAEENKIAMQTSMNLADLFRMMDK